MKDYKNAELFLVGKVESDDTMRDWIQQLEFEIVVDKTPELQITVDRKNKHKLSDSKPVAFLHFSSFSQAIKLIELSLKSAYLMLYGLNDSIDSYRMQQLVNAIVDKVKNDVEDTLSYQQNVLISKYKRQLRKHVYGGLNENGNTEIKLEFLK